MTRAELYALIDQVPDEKLEAVKLAVQVALIPEEEEEVSPEEAAAIEEGWQSYLKEGAIPDEEVWRKLEGSGN